MTIYGSNKTKLANASWPTSKKICLVISKDELSLLLRLFVKQKVQIQKKAVEPKHQRQRI